MKFLLLVTLFLTSPLLGNKPPEFWCRAEPVEVKGKEDYLRFALTLEEACDLSMRDCEKQYPNCEITGYGEW